MKDHELLPLLVCEQIFEIGIQGRQLREENFGIALVNIAMGRINFNQSIQNRTGLSHYQRGCQPDMGVKFAFALMAPFRRVFIIVMVPSHGDFLNTLIGMHHPQFRVGRGDFPQPGLFKSHADGKIDLGFGNRSHLPGTRLISGRAGARFRHDLNMDPLFANLLHKIFLGRDAHKDSQLFAGLGICTTAQ